jgi:predicted molibdopterin-dependent oxidoreductase YjgC
LLVGLFTILSKIVKTKNVFFTFAMKTFKGVRCMKNSLKMNGRELEFQPGQTLIDVAKANGIHIPTLCHLKGLTPTGACRVCVVEVEKARSLIASCCTPAAPGMVVITDSPKVITARKTIVELLFSSGKHDCIMCSACGDCELQKLANDYQINLDRFNRTSSPYPIEAINPMIVRDFAKCVLCGRCVQACNEVQVNQAISFGYRGRESKIVAAADNPLLDSDCVFCGECIQACPTGALVEKQSMREFKSWESKKIQTTCPYCGVGCQQLLHVKDNRVIKVTGVKDVAPNNGSLCVKGRFGFDFINSPERLTTPLIKENNQFREATWDEALNLVADRLGKVKTAYGSDSIGVLTSARITNEENYVANKFARAVLKTNNIDHCARL